MAQVGRVDLAKPYGGTLTLTATGDLAIVQDTPDSSAATIQRIEHLLQTNPRMPDPNGGGYITRPDDLFNPDWGGGLQTSVGEMVTDKLLGDMRARIIAAISSDPYIAKNPAPTVDVTDLGNGYVQIDVECFTITGQLVTVPSKQLQIF